MLNPWKHLLENVKKSGKRGSFFKEKNDSIDITWRDLEELFDKQDRKCYWFDIPLNPADIFIPYYPLAISVDRLSNLCYYQKSNIVICCRLANLGRSKFDSKKFRKIIDKIKKEI
ncbi:MAG: hypothetical protein AABY22_06530 [Nanoarchaeota archaeon]